VQTNIQNTTQVELKYNLTVVGLIIDIHDYSIKFMKLNAFSPQGVTFDHALIFDALGALQVGRDPSASSN